MKEIDIEELLKQRGKETEQLQAPEDMEMRLRGALDGRGNGAKRRRYGRLLAAAIIVVCLFIGYNADAIAFYAKQLAGYEPLMGETLKKLNESGKGQAIGEKYTFSDGTVVILDGAMLDDNQLILFYTLRDESGNADKLELEPNVRLEGTFGRYFMHSASGTVSSDKTELKYITQFDVPNIFDNKLNFCFTVARGKETEAGKIEFRLNRSKAMGHILKKSLNSSIKVDGAEIYLSSILATPTKTTVKGSMRNILELAFDELLGERFRPQRIGIKLLADGVELPGQGAGMSTDRRGITFNNDFDALPAGLKTLQLQLVSYSADHDVNKQVELVKGGSQAFKVLDREITVDDVHEVQGETRVTITTEESIILTKVKLIADGKEISLKNTDTGSYDKYADGKITHTRTLHFSGTGSKLQLDIRRMTYEEECNEIIDIPVE